MIVHITSSRKVGAYNRALNEPTKMNPAKKDAFLLFGPVDSLAQFCGLKNPGDFFSDPELLI
jgi:hypothetical protein